MPPVGTWSRELYATSNYTSSCCLVTLQSLSHVSLAAHHSNGVEIWLHTLHKQPNAIGFSKNANKYKLQRSLTTKRLVTKNQTCSSHTRIWMCFAEDIFDEESPNEGQSSRSATDPIRPFSGIPRTTRATRARQSPVPLGPPGTGRYIYCTRSTRVGRPWGFLRAILVGQPLL